MQEDKVSEENMQVIDDAFKRAMARRQSSHQQRVEAFINKFRKESGVQPLPSIPTVPDGKMILAQAKLILEETLEVFEACGLYITDRFKTKFKREELWLEFDKTNNIELDHVAKELADLSVVTTGMFSEFGIADVPILEEVDTNNLKKFGPGSRLDENRKWRKPPGHPSPDIKSLLIAQGMVEQTKPEVNHEEPAKEAVVHV